MLDLCEGFSEAGGTLGMARSLTSIVAEGVLATSVDAPTDLVIDP
jgi:hypothetical protein